MADFRPFKAVRYDTDVVGDLSEIICPPFDTIPPELQGSLHQRSPYNVVRLEAGEKLPSDTPLDDRYTRAADLFRDWTNEGVLVRDEQPAFYLVRHTFRTRDTERARLELMGCVRLEDYRRHVVLPHEYTRDEDKRDRLELMSSCHANFSPIMCLYRDTENGLAAIFQRVMAEPPVMDFSDATGQGYKVWRLDDVGRTDDIQEVLSDKNLYIADGHHRYETALAYRDLMVSRLGEPQSTNEAFNFVMMGLINFDDPGLTVLPYHRVVSGLDKPVLYRVRHGLDAVFDAAPFPQGCLGQLEKVLAEIELRGKDRAAMALLDPGSGAEFQLLTLKDPADLDAFGPVASSEAWIIEERVLKPVLGDSLSECLTYIHDGEEATKKLRAGECQLGFFLRPFPLDLFETIVDLGHRLPPKSTFFYPKLATGLVINLLEGSL